MRKVISLYITLLSLLFSHIATAQEVYVNQLGYFPDEDKYAITDFTGSTARKADIINLQTKETILSIPINTTISEPLSKSKVSIINFRRLTTPGNYVININNNSSHTFTIGNNIYNKALYFSARSFYLQSCGININDRISGINRPPCHLQDGYIKRGDKYNSINKHINSVGGWHDAGDYGKYIASTSTSTALLMLAYNNYKTSGNIKLDIPNTTELPDLLWEVKYALEWMLKQQRPDGAVYRKTSGDKWPADNVLPQNDTQKRYIYGVSSQDTAKFAATMALAARTYKSFNPYFADKCLKTSTLAWQYLKGHGYYLDYSSSDDSGSGGYPNPSYDTEQYPYTDTDDRLWTAAELYLATGNSEYLSYVKNNANKVPYEAFSWKNPAIMAAFELSNNNCTDANLSYQLTQHIINNADRIMVKMDSNAYAIPIKKFKWGSNAEILSHGITLTFAYRITGDDTYKNYALKTLNYVFGCNPMNKSYITGLGSNPVKHVHHRYFTATGKTISGFMVGGPNNRANDNVAKPGLGIKSYIDDSHSYATNEYAIDYNTPLVFMLIWANSVK